MRRTLPDHGVLKTDHILYLFPMPQTNKPQLLHQKDKTLTCKVLVLQHTYYIHIISFSSVYSTFQFLGNSEA